MTIDTRPRGRRDAKASLYIYFYDDDKKFTRRRATGWKNTREGKASAKIFLKKLNAQIQNKQFMDVFKMNLEEIPNLINAFEKFKVHKKDSTLSIYIHAFSHFLKCCGNTKIYSYTKEHGKKFIKYLEEKNLSVNTLHTYTAHMDIFWKYLIKKNYCKTNIITVIKEEEIPVRMIKKTDLELIFSKFKETNSDHYFTFKFLYYTAFRQGTFLIIKNSDIIFEQKLIYYRNRKSKKNSAFPLHEKLEILLSECNYVKEDGRITNFTSRSSIYNAWKRMVQVKLGLNYTVHQLRKSFASQLALDGMSLSDIQDLLGHSSSRTTNKYYRVSQLDRLRKAIGDCKNIT